MVTFLPSVVILFVFTLLATASFIVPAVRRLALNQGWVDDPGRSNRKIHKKAIAYLGGAAIFGGFIIGVGAYFVFLPQLRLDIEFPMWLPAYLAGAAFILAIGTADDIYDISPVKKLLAEIAIASMVFIGGIQLDHIVLPYYGLVEFGQLSAPITVLVLVITMNAVNLIDGLDGLAASIVAVAAVGNAVLSLHLGNMSVFILSLLLLASTLGFLKHNWNPARIFLGDGGSLLLGYLIGILGIQNISSAGTFSEGIFPFMVLLYPVLDVGMAIGRRIIRGKPMMSADRAHIHHRLLELGLSQEMVSIVVIAFASVLGVSGFMFVLDRSAIGLGTLIFGVLFALLGFVFFDYFNREVLRNIIRLRPLFKKHNAYKKLALVRIKYASSLEELWGHTSDAAREYGLSQLVWASPGFERVWADENSTSGKEYLIELDKSGGTVKYTVPDHLHEDLHAEIESIMRYIISNTDRHMSRVQKRNGNGSPKNGIGL